MSDDADLPEAAEAELIERPESDQVGDVAQADDLIIHLDDDPAEADDERESGLVKHLRETNRAQAREMAKLRAAQPAPAEPIIGPRPTLEQSGWDEAAHETALEKWLADKAKVDAATSTRQAAAERLAEKDAAARLRYAESRSNVKAADYEDAELAVQAALGNASAVIMRVSREPTKVVLALGRHPDKLAALAKLADDPIELIAEVVRLEGNIKMGTKFAPTPEKVARGSGSLSGSRPDAVLGRLEAEAARTGDRTKLIAYKREKNNRA